MFKKIVLFSLLALPFAASLLEANCSGGCCSGQCGRRKKTTVTHRPAARCRSCQGGCCSR